jgi:hypothetical protein
MPVHHACPIGRDSNLGKADRQKAPSTFVLFWNEYVVGCMGNELPPVEISAAQNLVTNAE